MMPESGLLNNRYRLLELVGSGGMAVVYRAMDLLLQREVAIKILREDYASDPAFLARFQREAQAAARLHHPNIVTVYDVGQEGACHYIVMESVDGQDLKTLIREEGRLSVSQALDIAIQICAGAGHAHQAGVIHCDIKPQNVLLTQEGVAKVTDFGIARALSELELTQAETVWGSPLYLSPEQAAGDPPSPASDVYSIGIILYEMLAGSPPFQAENATALALMHMREDPPPLSAQNPQVGSQLELIIRRVLAKEPAARYRTAEQLAYVLQEYRTQGDQRTGWQPAAPLAPLAAELTLPTVEGAQPGEADPQEANKLTLVFSVIACIAVIGLIPLWLMVYRVYSQGPTLPAATLEPGGLATLTPTVGLVEVPGLVGRSLEEAQQMLKTAGLRYVLDEQATPGAERGVVLDQRPAQGVVVPQGAEVTLVVNRLGRELVMPEVTGYELSAVREGLQSDGIQVRVEEVWSQSPAGIVLAQEPAAATTIYSDDPITLTVSGPQDIPIPLEVNLADQLELLSAQVHSKQFAPGDVVALTLRWRALRNVPEDYTVFVHLIGPDGAMASQQDVRPALPTINWTSGVEIVDPHQLTLPASGRPGLYQLRVGLYPPGQPAARLPVFDVGKTTADSDSILVVELQVEP